MVMIMLALSSGVECQFFERKKTCILHVQFLFSSIILLSLSQTDYVSTLEPLTCNGGEKNSKLDWSQAYQQIKLNPEAGDLLTANILKKLFRPAGLQFAVHSASGFLLR